MIFHSLTRPCRRFTFLIVACLLAIVLYVLIASKYFKANHNRVEEVNSDNRRKSFDRQNVIGADTNRPVSYAKKYTSMPVASAKTETAPWYEKTHSRRSIRPHRSYSSFSKSYQISQPIVKKLNFTGPSNDRQKAVLEAFRHAWSAYVKYAWGHDELRPVTQSWHDWMGIGLTIVDAIDTAYIMGLESDYDLAKEWIRSNLSFTHRDEDVQLFEITIRALGGLLSIYHLSGEELFLKKAVELGSALYPCFIGATKVPCNRINMKRGSASFIEISTAETGSIQLEFRDLGRSSGDAKYEDAMNSISNLLHNLPKLDGLVPCFMNPFAGVFHVSSSVSIGASCDSYYEYLLKQWIQTGKTKDWLRDDYLTAVEGVRKRLLRFSQPSGLAFVGSYTSYSSPTAVRNEMEHLACFFPGTLALGVYHGLNKSHLTMAQQLMKTCYEMYRTMPTGLSPEVVSFNQNPAAKQDIIPQFNNRYNIHRPETVESLFYLYRLTGDPVYRDWGWKIFEAFEKYTRLEEGYASVDNVLSTNPVYKDKMETFYLAETLKYLYLLFSDDQNLFSLDEFVFNTEAHPLPVYSR